MTRLATFFFGTSVPDSGKKTFASLSGDLQLGPCENLLSYSMSLHQTTANVICMTMRASNRGI